jgi:hypothetical protein
MHRTLCFFFFLDQIVRVVSKIDHASTQAIGSPHFWAVLEKLYIIDVFFPNAMQEELRKTKSIHKNVKYTVPQIMK